MRVPTTSLISKLMHKLHISVYSIVIPFVAAEAAASAFS